MSGRSERKKCSRQVHSSKYERGSQNDQIWWNDLFEILEKDYKVPAHKRKAVVQEVFPTKVVKKLTSILSFDEPIDVENDITDSKGNPLKDYGNKYVEPVKRLTVSSKAGTRISDEDIDEDPRKKSRNVGRNNPYLNFFKRRPDRAAIWRELPPLALHEMNLTQKADAVTENIASDFVSWLKSIGGDKQASLDVPTIMNMFEIGFSLHAATSLCIKIKEMPSVTREVALKRKLPQASIRAQLRRQLKRDIAASNAKDSNIAFGKMLPKSLRCYRLKEDIYHKWIESHRIPSDLATMAAVWQGIEGLRSTRAFCSYLCEHPGVPEPIYLKQRGMLEPQFYENTRFSQDTIDFKVGLAGVDIGVVTTTDFKG